MTRSVTSDLSKWAPPAKALVKAMASRPVPTVLLLLTACCTGMRSCLNRPCFTAATAELRAICTVVERQQQHGSSGVGKQWLYHNSSRSLLNQ